MLLKLNEKENSVMVVATEAHGMSLRFQPQEDPETGLIMMGGFGQGRRDIFLFVDPNEGWAPKSRYIKEWITNGYYPPAINSGEDEFHFHCLYCKADGYYYTRYSPGQLVKINPKTWVAEIIYMMPKGVTYGFAFHPKRPTELWVAYGRIDGGNLLYTIDVTDPAGTIKALNETGQGHRDGRLNQALFNNMRQINFDSDGNLFIGDGGNHCIRKVDTENMTVETLIGIPESRGFRNGKKEDALFADPHGLITDSEGVIYIGDYDNNRIRRIAIE
jgi:hypothetical protein